MDPILIFIGSDMSFFIVFVQLITYNAKNYLLGQSKKDLFIIENIAIFNTFKKRKRCLNI